MTNPSDLRYIKEHDWVRVDADGLAIFGITDHAQDSLGDVVFVDLPDPGSQVAQSESFGEIESVKAVSELIAPVSGTVVERNEAVVDAPELVNESPYEDGWLLKVAVADASELDGLMSAEEYDSFLASGS
jgi:glycine cleavage system H protein